MNAIYERRLAAGDTGGELADAGGSGHLALYVPSDEQQRLGSLHANQLHFQVSQDGARFIHKA